MRRVHFLSCSRYLFLLRRTSAGGFVALLNSLFPYPLTAFHSPSPRTTPAPLQPSPSPRNAIFYFFESPLSANAVLFSLSSFKEFANNGNAAWSSVSRSSPNGVSYKSQLPGGDWNWRSSARSSGLSRNRGVIRQNRETARCWFNFSRVFLIKIVCLWCLRYQRVLDIIIEITSCKHNNIWRQTSTTIAHKNIRKFLFRINISFSDKYV